ncbi:hypothetical protein CTI12_AA217360 [Artemisia annua]|uniref:CCHC-type domain-containing protein n=1 Tax=Artemisia annua TaxID=35608 RepID=A0A2U1NXG4_ARTAN|nr:hypothetical protein CTI12_AA217360 [Artemisia annua]
MVFKVYECSHGQQRTQVVDQLHKHGPYVMKEIDDSEKEGKKRLQTKDDLDQAELAQFEADIRAKNLILYELSNDIYNAIDSNLTAYDLWKALERLMQESLEDAYIRFNKLINEMNRHNLKRSNIEHNSMFLTKLQLEWRRFTIAIRKKQDLTAKDINNLFDLLKHNQVEKNERNDGGQDNQDPKCFGYGQHGHFAKNCPNGKVRNKAYYRQKMLLADMEEKGKMLNADENDFMVDTDDEGELLETNMVYMASLEKVDVFEAHEEEATPSYDTDADDSDNLVNHVHTSDACDYDALDELTHGHPRTISKPTAVTTRSETSTSDNTHLPTTITESNHSSTSQDHVDMLQNYATIQTQIQNYANLIKLEKDESASLEKKIKDMLYEEKSDRPLTTQTMYMLLPKPDSLMDLKQGLGYTQPSFLDIAKRQTPSLYNAGYMRRDTFKDYMFVPNEISQEEIQKCLNVTDKPYDSSKYVSLARKTFCHLRHQINGSLSIIHGKQECQTDELLRSNSCEVDVLKEVKKQIKTFIETPVNSIRDKFKIFDDALMSEMQNDLKYVTSLQDEYVLLSLNSDIQKEYSLNQMESIKPQLVLNEEKIKNVENKQTSLELENLILTESLKECLHKTVELNEELSCRTPREPYGSNDMLHNKELEIAKKQALLSKDMPLDAPLCSLTPPPMENKPKGSKKYKNKNRKKQKLASYDQTSKSPNARLLFDPGLDTSCSSERPPKIYALKNRASQPQVLEKPRYFKAFIKKRSKRMDDCNDLNVHGYVACNSKNACYASVTYNSASFKRVHVTLNCVKMNANTTRTATSNVENTKQREQWVRIPMGKMFEQYKERPITCLKWIPAGRVFKQVGYRWLPVKKKSEPSINKTVKFYPLGCILCCLTVWNHSISGFPIFCFLL